MTTWIFYQLEWLLFFLFTNNYLYKGKSLDQSFLPFVYCQWAVFDWWKRIKIFLDLISLRLNSRWYYKKTIKYDQIGFASRSVFFLIYFYCKFSWISSVGKEIDFASHCGLIEIFKLVDVAICKIDRVDDFLIFFYWKCRWLYVNGQIWKGHHTTKGAFGKVKQVALVLSS